MSCHADKGEDSHVRHGIVARPSFSTEPSPAASVVSARLVVQPHGNQKIFVPYFSLAFDLNSLGKL